MTEDRRSDWLGIQLRDEPYIDNGGFSARVLSALPPPRRARSRRRLLFGMAALLGGVLAFSVFPGAEYVSHSLVALFQYEPGAGSVPIVPLVVLAALTWGVLAGALVED